MRSKAIVLAFLLALPLAVSADEVVKPGGVRYDTAGVTEITDCVVAGTDSSSITAGRYEVCAYDEDVYLCEAATCASAGLRFAAGGACRFVQITTTATFSCRSVGSVGDIQFAPVIG